MGRILIGNIKGPQGIQGPKGATGPIGPAGPQGPLPPLINNGLATQAGVAALDAAMGGTLTAAVNQLNSDIPTIEFGYATIGEVPAGTYLDYVVNFKQTFKAIPVAIVTNGSASEVVRYGSMSMSAINISKTRFTIRYYNDSDYKAYPFILWIAIL